MTSTNQLLQDIDRPIQSIAFNFSYKTYGFFDQDEVAQRCKVAAWLAIKDKRDAGSQRKLAICAAYSAAKDCIRRGNTLQRHFLDDDNNAPLSVYKSRRDIRKQIEARDLISFAYRAGSSDAKRMLRVLFSGNGFTRDGGSVSVRICGELAGLGQHRATRAFKEIKTLIGSEVI